MIPKFLQPEVFPYASIEIVRAEFHTFLTHPSTGPKLDAMLADCARVDAAAVVIPFVDVAIVPPAGPVRPVRPVLDVELEPEPDEDDESPYDEACGSACSLGCGYCGRCS